MSTVRYPLSGPGFTQADGRVTVDLALNQTQEWHEITVSIFDSGSPATGVTGTLAGEVLKTGADQPEDFTNTLNLAAGERAWDPELSRAQQFFFTPTGLNAGFEYFITVNSWEG